LDKYGPRRWKSHSLIRNSPETEDFGAAAAGHGRLRRRYHPHMSVRPRILLGAVIAVVVLTAIGIIGYLVTQKNNATSA
jgi:hypothetical protein